MNPRPAGRQLLQIPGPSNLPDEIQRALAQPLIDHRGPEFADLVITSISRLKRIFGTEGDLVLFPSSGTGAWEAALVNTLSPGDLVVGFDQGHFANAWHQLAQRLGLRVEVLPTDTRLPPNPDQLRERLASDHDQTVKAVLLVHNETSTGVCVDITSIRTAIDDADHPALLLADAISSLASTNYQHDEWGIDVTIAASQKGLMLPPGLSFNAISEKALAASSTATLPRSYWDWAPHREVARTGWFPYTPPTSLLQGLHESLNLLSDEGLPNVYQRHRRHSEITRAAIAGWELETYCRDEAAASATVTAILFPEDVDAEQLRALMLERFDLVLGVGLGVLRGRVIRLGHLGSLNDLMLMGALAGVELGLRSLGFAGAGGVEAAIEQALAVRPVAAP
jgi:alanine-glyoxylate transaminase / serine-glyoxylate transaminase / serine-pyruvate transaminase